MSNNPSNAEMQSEQNKANVSHSDNSLGSSNSTIKLKELTDLLNDGIFCNISADSTFHDVWKLFDFDAVTQKIYATTQEDVEHVLSKSRQSPEDLMTLFSPAAESYLEQMAIKAADITKERFGNTILLYAPIYLSNVCANGCTYCGFSSKNKNMKRVTLTDEQIADEVKALNDMGIKHTLILCGEAPAIMTVEYLSKAVKQAKKHASFVGIEIYPMSEDEYSKMVKAGVDGLTVYQETYDKITYEEVHPIGKKRDIQWRLEAPDRGARAGMRSIGVGALLGLSEPRTDAFFAALHAAYLTKLHWKSNITLSFPRMRSADGAISATKDVNDKMLVQFMVASRMVLHDLGIIISTRENSTFRDNVVGLGVTQMSAASVTVPGGYSNKDHSTAQFQVEDTRSVEEFSSMLRSKGYDPVLKDWDTLLSATD